MSKRKILKDVAKRVRSFVGRGVGVHVSRKSVYEHRGFMEAGLGWNWRRVWTVEVYGGKSVSQGIEVTAVDADTIAGDVLEAVIDYHPEWLKVRRNEG